MSATPTVLGGKVSDINATMYSGGTDTKRNEKAAGSLFDGKYKIISRIGGNSSQANVYLAEATDSQILVAIKVYSQSFVPDYDMLEKFKKIASPHLAKLLGYGKFEGEFYEVYKYYKNGNILDKLCDRPLDDEYIEKVAVPSLSDALNTLHENGIVHADVKPENILVGDDEQSLVLSDYGISAMLDRDGFAYKEIQGTLAYAPRADQHFGEIKLSTAWDFGALGLVLITLVCGRGLFEGMNNDEIFKEWEKGIEIPSAITGRLRSLISGLIEQDEEKRFGYAEVERWCEGDIVNTSFKRHAFVEKKDVQPLIVAIVDGKVISVNSPEEFAREVLKNWEAARVRVFESQSAYSIIKKFLMQFDGNYFESIKKYLGDNDKDKALFCVAYKLFPQKEIYYKGRRLGMLDNLFSDENISENASALLDFVQSDLLGFYLDVNEYERNVMDSIKVLLDIANGDGNLLYYLLMFSFAKEKILHIGDFLVKSIDDLSGAVVQLGVQEVLSEKYRNELYAWLYCMGYGHEVEMMRKRDVNEQ